MITINMSPDIGLKIKNARVSNSVKAKDLAKHLEKSPAYITKLENGDIKKIDIDTLSNILAFITKDETALEKFISDELAELLKETNNKVFYSNFDTVYRKISIPETLIEQINNILNENSYTIKEIVDYTNRNEDIIHSSIFKSNDFDINTVEKNVWHAYLDENNKKSEFIFLFLKADNINSILNGKIKKSNYITLLSFVYHIYKKLNSNKELKDIKDISSKQAEQLLHHNHFYSLSYKHMIKDKKELSHILNSSDSKFINLTKELVKKFEFFSDIDVDYTNKKLESITKNAEHDFGFWLALASVDISKIENKDKIIKKDLLKEIQNLIAKYENKENKEVLIDKY